ncbi:hypothetical protein ACVWYF_000437 [Hymenobacter sp. UYAg731]
MKNVLLLCLCLYCFAPNAHAQVALDQGPKLALSGAPAMQGGRPAASELDKTGWRFEAMPRVAALDKKSGEARFKLVVNAAGTLDSVVTVSSTVSARQEALCRMALETARFVAINGAPGRATGFYTFRFIIR